MKFKLHWGKARVITRFRSPLQETDYEGNDLWALAFPKMRPISEIERYLMSAYFNANLTSQQYRYLNANPCYHPLFGGGYNGPR